MYQGIQPGGQLTITTEVENYPGYPDGIQGPEMMVNFENQAARMGADIRYGLITDVEFSSYPLKVQVDEEKWLSAYTVIISTGASAKWLGLESAQPADKLCNKWQLASENGLSHLICMPVITKQHIDSFIRDFKDWKKNPISCHIESNNYSLN